MNKLIELSPLTCMKLWGELIECYHNKNGYGGDTAEIYAYRLKVGAESMTELMAAFPSREREGNLQAAKRLVDLVKLFQSQYSETTITIDDQSIDAWLACGEQFGHRCHLRIQK